jgi:hypothetical protein
MKKTCFLSIPHEAHAPIVSDLVWWLVTLPNHFRGGQCLVDCVPSGEYGAAVARNTIVRRFLSTNCDWLWMVDSDMHPGIHGELDGGTRWVIEAMERDDVDVLTGFFFRMSEKGPVPSVSTSRSRDYLDRAVFGKPPGLHQVDDLRAGGACLAIKRRVVETMLEKRVLWFKDVLEETDPEKWGDILISEDVWFFNESQRLGFKTWIDTRLVWGHVKPLDMRDELERTNERVGRILQANGRPM